MRDCKLLNTSSLAEMLIIARYSVKGWCVRQARLKDTLCGEWKEGDILYEVSLERHDPVPMEEVVKRPTNMEVDDYAEYKRLRKLHRENKRKGSGPPPMPPKTAPPLPSSQLPANSTMAPHSLLRVSPSGYRETTFKDPAFDAPTASQDLKTLSTPDVVSPMTVSSLQDSFFAPREIGILVIPARKDKNKLSPVNSTDNISPDNTSPEKHIRVLSPGAGSLGSSSRSARSELKEIIPWIELEAEPPTPPSLHVPAVVKEQTISKALDRPEFKAAELNPVKSVRRLARDSRQQSDLSLRSLKPREKDIATNALDLRLYPAKPMMGKKKGKGKEAEGGKCAKRIVFGKEPTFFDGADYTADEEEEDHYGTSPSKHRRTRSSSADSTLQLHSPIPIRPPRPHSLFNYGIEDIEFTSPLDNLICRPRMALPVNNAKPLSTATPRCSQGTGESIALGKLKRWLSK